MHFPCHLWCVWLHICSKDLRRIAILRRHPSPPASSLWPPEARFLIRPRQYLFGEETSHSKHPRSFLFFTQGLTRLHTHPPLAFHMTAISSPRQLPPQQRRRAAPPGQPPQPYTPFSMPSTKPPLAPLLPVPPAGLSSKKWLEACSPSAAE